MIGTGTGKADDGFGHYPVLHREVTEFLTWKPGAMRLIDGTLGCGGHSSLILQKNRQAELLGIDRDGDALERAGKALAFAEDRVRLMRGNFSELAVLAAEVGWPSWMRCCWTGISSPQIDDAERDFMRLNGPSTSDGPSNPHSASVY